MDPESIDHQYQSVYNEIINITAEIKRLNLHIKTIRNQKKAAETILHKYMVDNDIDQIGVLKEKRINPIKTPRKKKREKKEDAIRFFHEAGIENAEEFYDGFEETQKYHPPPEEEVVDEGEEPTIEE